MLEETTCRTVCCSVGDFHEPFDLALALHSCGGAADAVQAAALAARASFVIAPCCYGFVQDAVQTDAESSAPGSAEIVHHVPMEGAFPVFIVLLAPMKGLLLIQNIIHWLEVRMMTQ